jgi:hypothetical protein
MIECRPTRMSELIFFAMYALNYMLKIYMCTLIYSMFYSRRYNITNDEDNSSTMEKYLWHYSNHIEKN